ncbi:glycine-rich domain-containing protein [Mycolicibacterium mageritense]|uniref:Glycine-rich domain-containing protein n=1 Tax=Mycolicibacterium mageritense TaxID=53462 RepID=A0AAI8XQT4_MYCME|nr:hypothetical protein hbim_05373 [Mycolicibacterium mageritense]
MALYVGGVPIIPAGSGVYIGDQLASAVYLGTQLIWERFSETHIENTDLSDAPVPEGASGCWVTLIGGGGGGGGGRRGATDTSRRGGPGGGGAAVIVRVWIPAALLGPTYSVSRGFGGSAGNTPSSTGNGIAGTDGGASVFTSGDVMLTAGGGGGATGATSTANGTVGAGGTWSATGVTATGANGTAGGQYNSTTPNNTAGGAAGGGAGAGFNSSNLTLAARAGGDTIYASGGAIGTNGPDQSTGVPGSGGGGANNGSSQSVGRGGLYGGGGGGAGSTTGGSNTAGVGADGYSLVEWTDQNPSYSHTDIFNTPGAWSWIAPPELAAGDRVDVILCSGGRGGWSGSGSPGIGGQAGTFAHATITIGTEIGVGGTLSGSIGSGGSANDGNGGNTTCTTIGLTALGATARMPSGIPGGTPGTVKVNGITYGGGSGGQSYDDPGRAPGGGGAGGSVFGNGGAGAGGKVWIRAYQV